MQPCTQEERIAKIEKALFGDPNVGEVGAVALIKDTHRSVLEMRPSYKLIRDTETFATVATKISRWLFFMIVFLGALISAIYGMKEWIKK